MALADLIFGIVGNVISCMMFAAPLPTFWRIFKNKSTEDFKALPYVVCLLSVLMWVFYGCIIPNGTLVISINVIGIAFETMYLVLYMTYAPKSKRRCGLTDVQGGIVLVLLSFGVVTAVGLLAVQGDVRKLLVGTICAVISVSMYASPLGILKLVIQTKSVEFLPFTLSLFLFLNGAVWSLFAFVKKDIFIAIPNGIGCFFGLLQIVIWIYYTLRGSGSASAKGKPAPGKGAGDIEKGSTFEVGKQNVYPVPHDSGLRKVGEKEDKPAVGHQSNEKYSTTT